MIGLPQTDRLIRAGIEDGLHPGGQLCVWRADACVVDAAFGEAKQGVAMTRDSVMLWLSAGKPITAIAVAQLLDQGLLDLGDPVVEYIPEFAQRGKDEITLGHVLTHTGGFRSAVFKYPQQSWDESIAAVCEARLETGWELGQTAGYHAHTGWNILARVIEVCVGEPIGIYLRRAVLEPLGMNDSWVGMPSEVYDGLGDRLSVMQDTTRAEPKPSEMDGKDWLIGTRPGGNACGPANELARFYRMLLQGGSLDGAQIVKPGSVAEFTRRHREGQHDRTFGATIDWGLGFILNSKRHDAVNHGPAPYGYGPHASDDTFGHGGNTSSVAFADPKHRLAVALVFNGMPGEPKHQKRMNAILASLYEDLGLAN